MSPAGESGNPLDRAALPPHPRKVTDGANRNGGSNDQGKAAREARLAAALRNNLRRRKAPAGIMPTLRTARFKGPAMSRPISRQTFRLACVLPMLTFGAAAVGAPAWAQTPPPVAIHAGRLIDPAAGKVLTDQIIVIQGDRIIAVGPSGKGSSARQRPADRSVTFHGAARPDRRFTPTSRPTRRRAAPTP